MYGITCPGVYAESLPEINKFKSRFKEEFLVPNNSKFRPFLGGISFRDWMDVGVGVKTF